MLNFKPRTKFREKEVSRKLGGPLCDTATGGCIMTRTDAYVTIFLVLAQRTVQHVCCDHQSILLLMALISTQSGIKQLFPLRFLKNKRILTSSVVKVQFFQNK